MACSGQQAATLPVQGLMMMALPTPDPADLCISNDHVRQRQIIHPQCHAVQLVRIHVQQHMLQRFLCGAVCCSLDSRGGGCLMLLLMQQSRLFGGLDARQRLVELPCRLPSKFKGSNGFLRKTVRQS